VGLAGASFSKGGKGGWLDKKALERRGAALKRRRMERWNPSGWLKWAAAPPCEALRKRRIRREIRPKPLMSGPAATPNSRGDAGRLPVSAPLWLEISCVVREMRFAIHHLSGYGCRLNPS
jgi:hypothetical protein